MRSIEPALLFACLAMAVVPAAAQPSPPYAGSEACAVWHEDIANALAKSAHHVVDIDKRRGWDGRACESCHGPGQKHAESGDATLIMTIQRAVRHSPFGE